MIGKQYAKFRDFYNFRPKPNFNYLKKNNN